MILDGKRRQRPVPDTLDRTVIQIDMRNFEAIGNGIRKNREIVVLACDLDVSRLLIPDWMVAAVMSEFQPSRLRSAGQRQKLMSEADAENWDCRTA